VFIIEAVHMNSQLQEELNEAFKIE